MEQNKQNNRRKGNFIAPNFYVVPNGSPQKPWRVNQFDRMERVPSPAGKRPLSLAARQAKSTDVRCNPYYNPVKQNLSPKFKGVADAKVPEIPPEDHLTQREPLTEIKKEPDVDTESGESLEDFLLRLQTSLPDTALVCLTKHLRALFPEYPLLTPFEPVEVDPFFKVKSKGVHVTPPARQLDFSRVLFATAAKARVFRVMEVGLDFYTGNGPYDRDIRYNSMCTQQRSQILNVYLDVTISKLECCMDTYRGTKFLHMKDCNFCKKSRDHYTKLVAQSMICDFVIMPLNLYYSFYKLPIVDWNLPGWCYSIAGIHRFALHPMTQLVQVNQPVAAVWKFLNTLWYPSLQS